MEFLIGFMFGVSIILTVSVIRAVVERKIEEREMSKVRKYTDLTDEQKLEYEVLDRIKYLPADIDTAALQEFKRIVEEEMLHDGRITREQDYFWEHKK